MDFLFFLDATTKKEGKTVPTKTIGGLRSSGLGFTQGKTIAIPWLLSATHKCPGKLKWFLS